MRFRVIDFQTPGTKLFLQHTNSAWTPVNYKKKKKSMYTKKVIKIPLENFKYDNNSHFIFQGKDISY